MNIEMKDENAPILIQTLIARLGEQQKEIETLKAQAKEIDKNMVDFFANYHKDMCNALQGTMAVTDFHSGDVVTDGDTIYLLQSPLDEEGSWNVSASLYLFYNSFEVTKDEKDYGWFTYCVDIAGEDGYMDVDTSLDGICKVSSNELALFDYKLKEKGYKRNGGNVVKI